MLRRFVVALAVVALTSGSLVAAEIRGALKKIDPAKNCLVVTVNNEDRLIEMSPKAPVYTLVSVGRPRRATMQLQQSSQGLTALQPGMYVTVQTRERDGIEMATEIREDSTTTSSSGGRRRLLRR
jgi:hypothetical protein